MFCKYLLEERQIGNRIFSLSGFSGKESLKPIFLKKLCEKLDNFHKYGILRTVKRELKKTTIVL